MLCGILSGILLVLAVNDLEYAGVLDTVLTGCDFTDRLPPLFLAIALAVKLLTLSTLVYHVPPEVLIMIYWERSPRLHLAILGVSTLKNLCRIIH